ncbi:MAG: signal peptidase I [Clostridia bacterium]|nr:signal peptidase I [Clostridia bacterium]
MNSSPQKKGHFDFNRELFDWAESLVTSLVIIVLVFVFAFRLIGVAGSSMLPTLQDRNYLIVSDLGYTPESGDIVVVTKKGFLYNPRTGHDDSFVKRVIATEGQTVDIDYTAGVVYVDGEALDEPYTYTLTTRRGDMQFPCTVPEGHVFLLGDNRNGSTDSRYIEVGMIDERYIVGRVLFHILPLNKIGPVK